MFIVEINRLNPEHILSFGPQQSSGTFIETFIKYY